MAFNWQTFKTRALTAIIFAAVMLVGLLWNQWSFLVLFSIIHFGCWWEYLKLTERIHNTQIDIVIKYFFCICGFMIYLAVGFSNYSYDFAWIQFGYRLSLKWGLVFIAILSFFVFLFQNKNVPIKAKWFASLGFLYISLSWGLMINLRNMWTFHIPGKDNLSDDGWIIPLVIVVSIWINDTMAYIVGSIIGKTPLSKISPKKTWEGTIGGIILSIALIGGFAFYRVDWRGLIYPSNIIFIAGIAAITGTFGDLLESKLKRLAGVKDSGSLMPGHGGFLDRFDSLLLATPFVWLYVHLVMK